MKDLRGTHNAPHFRKLLTAISKRWDKDIYKEEREVVDKRKSKFNSLLSAYKIEPTQELNKLMENMASGKDWS